MDNAEHIGSVLPERMVHVTDLIEASVGLSASVDMQLATANQELRRSLDRETIRVVVETPVTSSRVRRSVRTRFSKNLSTRRG